MKKGMILNMVRKFESELSQEISKKIGVDVESISIHSDECGWYFYIPAKSLKSGYPLILRHYKNALFVVIPTVDWNKLEEGEIDVSKYIDTSYWNYGYFWGGGSMVGGVYWQPLENVPGIHEPKKIKRYLTILECRTNKAINCVMPSKEKCQQCYIEKCPFSKFAFKNEGASWQNEVPERDDRNRFLMHIRKTIGKRFGFETVYFMSGESSNVVLFPAQNEGQVIVNVPREHMINMLYHPTKCDVDILAGLLQYEVGSMGDDIRNYKSVIIPQNEGAEFCLDFWSKNCNIEWIEEAVEKKAIQDVPKENAMPKFLTWLSSLFKK